MIKPLSLLLATALVACRQEALPANTLAEDANVVAAAKPANECAAPALAIADGDRSFGDGGVLLRQTQANFAAAFASACAKGLMKDTPLIDPDAAEQDRIFLLSAPDANVASIYLPRGSKQMVLEYPFVTADGQRNVPPAEELEEAIYCSVRGATLEEQESSGRCLVD